MTHQEWCRDHAEEIIKNCPISKSQANRLRRAKKMGSDWPPLSPFPDNVLLAVGKLGSDKKIEIVAREVMARKERGEEVTGAIVEDLVRLVQEGCLTGVSPAHLCAASTERSDERPVAAPERETEEDKVHELDPRHIPTTFTGLSRYLRTRYSDREAEIVGKILAYLKEIP
jgi:hypothetical protein